MSGSCQQETQAPQQMASLFDHLVSPEDQRRRHIQTDGLGGFQVDREYELRRLLDRDVGRRNAVESLADFIRPAKEVVRIVWRIDQKCLSFVRPPSNGWQAIFHRQ